LRGRYERLEVVEGLRRAVGGGWGRIGTVGSSFSTEVTSLFKCLVLRPKQQFDGVREEQPPVTCWLRGEGRACRRAMDGIGVRRLVSAVSVHLLRGSE
jgi:hypothetical protein